MVHTTAFVTPPVVEHWLELQIGQWVNDEESISDPLHHEQMINRGATSRSCHDIKTVNMHIRKEGRKCIPTRYHPFCVL